MVDRRRSDGAQSRHLYYGRLAHTQEQAPPRTPSTRLFAGRGSKAAVARLAAASSGVSAARAHRERAPVPPVRRYVAQAPPRRARRAGAGAGAAPSPVPLRACRRGRPSADFDDDDPDDEDDAAAAAEDLAGCDRARDGDGTAT